MSSLSPPSNLPTSLPVRILTHNIRYATTSPFPNELPWAERKAGFMSELLYNTRHCPTSLICLQEVLHSQLLDILEGLNVPEGHAPLPDGQWSYVGVGRDDGKTAGEYSPIIYRSDVWRLDSWFTMWLSPTPWKAGSKGWDAASVRIMTAAKLSHRLAGTTLLATNTHLDDQGNVSRRKSASLIARTVREILAKDNVDSAFLAGDLNSEVTGEAYSVLNEEGSGLVDLQRLVDWKRYGDEMTFTGFDGHGDVVGRATKIDFIHLSTEPTPEGYGSSNARPLGESEASQEPRPQWHVQGYAVLPNRFEDGIYISDHRAVVGDVVLRRS